MLLRLLMRRGLCAYTSPTFTRSPQVALIARSCSADVYGRSKAADFECRLMPLLEQRCWPADTLMNEQAALGAVNPVIIDYTHLKAAFILRKTPCQQALGRPWKESHGPSLIHIRCYIGQSTSVRCQLATAAVPNPQLVVHVWVCRHNVSRLDSRNSQHCSVDEVR